MLSLVITLFFVWLSCFDYVFVDAFIFSKFRFLLKSKKIVYRSQIAYFYFPFQIVSHITIFFYYTCILCANYNNWLRYGDIDGFARDVFVYKVASFLFWCGSLRKTVIIYLFCPFHSVKSLICFYCICSYNIIIQIVFFWSFDLFFLFPSPLFLPFLVFAFSVQMCTWLFFLISFWFSVRIVNKKKTPIGLHLATKKMQT